MKKKFFFILAILAFLCTTPIMFDTLWDFDMFNLFPTIPSKGGEVDTATTGTNPSFGDVDVVGDLSVGVGYILLDKKNEWGTYCALTISFDKNRDHRDEVYMNVIARVGDEFKFDGYVIRVLRVFPYSSSILGYHRGEVTLEFIDLHKQSLP